MLFNSAIFIVLFFFLYGIYWFLPLRGKHYLIIVSGLIFYGWYSIPFLLLFLVLLIINFTFSNILLVNKSRKILWTAVVLNLSVLGFFKYFYLLATAAGYLLGLGYLIDLQQNWIRDYDFKILLPIGISFYTFQIIAYVVDSYRGVITDRITPVKFTVFFLYFPHFIAGPIMRSTDFIPQIDRPKINPNSMLDGVLIILQGVVKKVLIADRLGSITGNAWQDPSRYDATALMIIIPAFIMQIYCDFSGYTDMARGMSKLLGFEIPENFQGPFLSKSMQELWQRWHITLSSWLRDYIYIPLGGSRQGSLRTHVNILVTLGLGGFWHGATWNMLLWGVYIGSILVVERFFSKNNIRLFPENAFFNGIRIARTYILFALSTLLFASPDIQRTYEIIEGIVEFRRGLPLSDSSTAVGLMILVYLLNIPQYYPRIRERIKNLGKVKFIVAGVGILAVSVLVELYGDSTGSFIYFKF